MLSLICFLALWLVTQNYVSSHQNFVSSYKKILKTFELLVILILLILVKLLITNLNLAKKKRPATIPVTMYYTVMTMEKFTLGVKM